MDFVDFNQKNIKRSRFSYMLECSFEYFVALLVSDSFLAYLLTELGMSDSLIGIVSSLVSFAFLFELVALFVVCRIKNIKRFAIFFHTASNVLFLSLYLIPFIPALTPYRIPVTIICILLAYFGNYFVTSMIFNWGNSFVNPEKRAVFSSTKEMISLICGVVLSISLGYIMEKYKEVGNSNGWFLFAAISILIFSICDLICLLSIKKSISSSDEAQKPDVSLKESFRYTLGNKNFVNVIILACLWNFSVYFTVGFMGSYKNFLFSIAIVQIINACANFARFALSRPLGRFSDKFSYSKGISLGLCLAAIAFLANTFCSPNTRWLIIVYAVFYSLSVGATNQNLLNISYNFVPKEYYVQASAIKSSMSGLVGFGASILAGKLLEVIQKNGNTFFGLNIYGQQVLSFISFILLSITLLFNILTVQRQKTIGK